MAHEPRADVRRSLLIRMAILRQRSPWILRGLMDKSRLNQERATSALVDAIMAELDAYEFERKNRPQTPAPTTP